jgi:hypothetical protein
MPSVQLHAPVLAVGPHHDAASPELVEFVDFKWLMAGEGHPIDLDRLQSEPAYTRGCLALAGGSTSVTLRRAAERLARALGSHRPPRA